MTDRVLMAPSILSADFTRLADAVTLLEVSTAIFEEAGRLDPVIVRSLDAVHLAAALSSGDDLDAIVTHDDRLAEAARANGVAVAAPN